MTLRPLLGVIGCLGLLLAAGCESRKPASVAPSTDQEREEPVSNEVEPSNPVAPPAGPYGKSDAQRIEDVHTIVRAIEEYHARTGKLPFDEAFATLPEGAAPAPININLSGEELSEEYRSPPPGVAGSVLSRAEFIEYMQKVMGAGFALPVDPAPAPRFYQVHFDGRDYYVSAALHEPNAHTLPLGDDWHKYQVGSRADTEMGVRAVEEISGAR